MKKRNNNDKNSDKQSDKSFSKKDKNKKSSNSKRNNKTRKNNDLIEQPTEFVIPPDNNKLARINISVDDQSITNVELNNDNADNIVLQDKPLPINENEYIKETAMSHGVKLTPGTEKIWKYVALGKINMLYAQIGTSMDGRPILDHDLLSTVLVTYGFDIDNAIDFINDFAENSKDDNSAPIIMINSHMSDIMEMVEPIEHI
jgi:hypothetical protein